MRKLIPEPPKLGKIRAAQAAFIFLLDKIADLTDPKNTLKERSPPNGFTAV